MQVGSKNSSSGVRRVLEDLRGSALTPQKAAESVSRAQTDGALSSASARMLLSLFDHATFDAQKASKNLDAMLGLSDDMLARVAGSLASGVGRVDVADLDAILRVAQGGSGAVASPQALRLGHMMSRATPVVDDPARQARLDKQPLRTFVLDSHAGVPVVSRSTLKRVKPAAPDAVKNVSGAKLERALEKAADARKALLGSGLSSASLGAPRARVSPEDGSLVVSAFHMGYGLGPDQTGIAFPLQMAQIGKLEGFSVVLRVDISMVESVKELLTEKKLTNVSVMGIDGEGDFWSEDQGELDVMGNVRVPAPAPEISVLHEAGYRARIARLYPDDAARAASRPWEKLKDEIRNKYPDVLFSMAGAVADRKSHEVVAAVALGKGTSLEASLSHIEGGNLLTGTLPSGDGYALVGKDSLVHSKTILERDLGRTVSDDELMRAVAHDLGIDAANVIPVEQPGDFHIDMHMIPIKPGEVLLNDAVAATKLECQWELDDKIKDAPKDPGPNASADKRAEYKSDLKFHKELLADLKDRHKEMIDDAKKAQAFESRVVADLESRGIVVHRAPAVFGSKHMMSANFINAEQGTNAKGERFYIALGGDPRAEKVFLEHIEKLDTGIARVHLLDRELTRTTLQAGGGISCRTKAEGKLASM